VKMVEDGRAPSVRRFFIARLSGGFEVERCKLARTDGDSSPISSSSSERSRVVDATEEVLFLRMVGIAAIEGGVCGTSTCSIGFMSGQAAVGSVASGLVVLEVFRVS
jgi:hypothetical protein